MTNKQLQDFLKKFPDNMDIFLAERKSEFAYGLLNTVRVETIGFKEDPADEKVLAREKVIVLDEE